MFAGFFNSPLFLLVMGFTLIMQYIMVQYGGEWVGCEPLTGMHARAFGVLARCPFVVPP